MSDEAKINTVKINPLLLSLARDMVVTAVRPRLEPVVDSAGVGGFQDPAFVATWGVGLQNLGNKQLVDMALTLLIEHVGKQPPGKCGLPLIDG